MYNNMKNTILGLLLFISVTSFSQFKTTVSKLPININGVTLIRPVLSGTTVTLNFEQDAFWETKTSKSKMDAKANTSDLKKKADTTTVAGLKKTITQLNADVLLLRTTVQQLQSAPKPVPTTITPQKNYDSIINILTDRIASIPAAKNYDADIATLNSKIASIPVSSPQSPQKNYDADITSLNAKIAAIKIPAPVPQKNYDSAINSLATKIPAPVDLSPLIKKVNSVQSQLDSLPEIYIRLGHATKDNPL